MSSLTTKVSSEKALQLQLTCESQHKTTLSKFESFACIFQGTIFNILVFKTKILDLKRSRD